MTSTDVDGDNVPDVLDLFPNDPNEWADNDADGTGDNQDTDDDNDGLLDDADNCPLVANPDQTNTDGDREGDTCDTDDDNDGAPDTADCAPLISSVSTVARPKAAVFVPGVAIPMPMRRAMHKWHSHCSGRRSRWVNRRA